MKKTIITFVAALALTLSANAQYVMKVTQTNGQVTEFSADEVLSVSFDKGQLSQRTMLTTYLRTALQQFAQKNINFSALTLGNSVITQCASLLTAETIEKMKEDATKKVQERLKQVDANSELAMYGFLDYVEVDPKDFDGRFTFNEDGSFVKTDANQLEIVFPVRFEGQEPVMLETVIKGTGNTVKMALPYLPKIRERKRAMVLTLPEQFDITIGMPGMTLFNGQLKMAFEKKSQSQYVSLLTDKWTISGNLNAHIKGFAELGFADDENTISFSNSFDGATGQIVRSFGFKKNGLDIIERTAKVTLPQLPTTIQTLMSMLPFIMSIPAETSIADLAKTTILSLVGSGQAKQMVDSFLFGLLQDGAIDEATVTLFGDLSLTAKVKNLAAVIQTQQEMAAYRRSGADEKTIQQYVDQLNSNIELSGACKSLQQELPMKLITTQVGVDFWAMPAVKFADESTYRPLTELLDIKSLSYLLNIADHAVEPLSATVTSFGSIISSLANLILLNQAAEAEED